MANATTPSGRLLKNVLASTAPQIGYWPGGRPRFAGQTSYGNIAAYERQSAKEDAQTNRDPAFLGQDNVNEILDEMLFNSRAIGDPYPAGSPESRKYAIDLLRANPWVLDANPSSFWYSDLNWSGTPPANVPYYATETASQALAKDIGASGAQAAHQAALDWLNNDAIYTYVDTAARLSHPAINAPAQPAQKRTAVSTAENSDNQPKNNPVPQARSSTANSRTTAQAVKTAVPTVPSNPVSSSTTAGSQSPITTSGVPVKNLLSIPKASTSAPWTAQDRRQVLANAYRRMIGQMSGSTAQPFRKSARIPVPR